jgi:hypothetical protein
MNKKCKECSKEFESTNTKGSEQLYCSKSCRSKSASKRFQNNLIKKHNESTIDTIPEFNGGRFTTNNIGSATEPRYQRVQNNNEHDDRSRNFTTYDNSVIALLEKQYEARNECLFYQLKCESLQKEVEVLKQEIINLEMEIEESETEEESNGMISGLVSSFKQDPQSTISFASELITNFIKPKQPQNVK